MGEDFQCIYTSLPDVTDERSFYKCLCLELGEEVDTFSDLDRLVRLERLLKKKKVIACLDEFESVAAGTSFSENFFKSLRALAQSGGFALLLATERSLAELCRDERIATSPFWNIFHRTNLGLFSESEAEGLIRAGFERSGVEVTSGEASQVLELAGRFPFFLQRACYHLFEEKIGQAARWEQEFETDAADHLRYLWGKLNRSEQSALRWSLGFGERLPEDAILADLERRGLLVSGIQKQFGYWVFSEAFEMIVRNPPHSRKRRGWWNRLFNRFKGGKVAIGPTGISAEIQTKDTEDKR